MDNINDTLFTHWNTDSNGNPVSVAVTEDQVVSPIHLCIQLNQIPDDFQALNVYYNGTLMSEVYDTETIGSNNYKVDYGDGIVWFNASKAGKTIHFEYSGRGYKVVSAKRVMINDGDYVEENTLQHLVDLNKIAVNSVNNMQSNLDAILADCNKYANNLKVALDDKKYATQIDFQRAYNDLYTKMDKYVGDVLKNKTLAINEMNNLLSQYRQQASQATDDMEERIEDFVQKSEAYVSDLNNKYDTAISEIQDMIERVKSSLLNVNSMLYDYSLVQKKEMDKKTKDVEEYRVKIRNNMKSALDDLYTYSNERKQVLDNILQQVNEIAHDLQQIFEGRQLVWESEFNEAQLDRLDRFNKFQTSNQNLFDIAQVDRSREFNKTQDEQQDLFDEKESNRDEVFNAMKDMAYDENAILKGVQLSNTKFDDVQQHRESRNVDNPMEGGVRKVTGDVVEFYSNVVNEDGTTAKEKVKELFLLGRESTWRGTKPPVDTEVIWYDVSEEDWKDLPLPENVNLSQFQDTVNQIRDEISDVATSVRLEDIRPGTFFAEESKSNKVDENSSNVKHNRIKVGLNPKLMQLEEGELAYCMDTETLYIGVRKNEVSSLTVNKKVNVSSGGSEGGGTNLTGEYLQLDGKDGNKYRIYIDEDGELKQRLVQFLDVDKPSANDGSRFNGLLVNRYFGGGEKGNNMSPLSHGFIELYNNSKEERTIPLEGLALYYKTIDDPTWRRFELHGYIPWHCSYLIRGARVNSMDNSSCRYEISKFDQHWDREFSNTSAMIYLGVDTGALTIVNPYNLNDGTESKSYISILAGAGADEERSLTAVEYDKKQTPAYRRLLTPDCGIQRRDFAATKSTYKDVEQINFRTCDMSIYHPRCVEDGAWDLYYNKTKLNENVPNLVNIQYGKQWHTRTFTWQSKVMNRGYLRYRKIGTSQWIYKDTNTQIVYHKDGDCTIHRCIVRNLPVGVYEYQCGDEGYWGDIYTFEIKSYMKNNVPDTTQHIKFLQVSDQQSFYEDDYEAWRWASKYIEDHENPNDYDWVLNTGDISQSGNRSFEWRSYYKFPRFLREKPHILCCGNNDLFNKIYSNCFKYYDTTENDFDGDIYKPNYLTHSSIQGITPYGEGNYSSIWTFDLGYVHFINVNSNMTASVEDPDIWVKQMRWLKDEIAQCKRRPNPPRWYIMLTHYGALTVTRMQTVQQMIPFVEDLGIHLVICGHHHSYSRSQPVKMNIRSQVEAITGHDLYDVYSGCGQAITAAVYSIGYLESFADKKTGVHVVPEGATYDQTTPTGTNEDGSQGKVTNGNEGSRQAYVNQQKGTYWVMCNATGSKLKSNKDLEKTPTPWWYGWAKYNEATGWSNNEHPYRPNYIMWDISYDSITLKSYVVEGIMEYDKFLKDAVVIPPNEIDYSEMSKTLIDEFTIPWRNLEE